MRLAEGKLLKDISLISNKRTHMLNYLISMDRYKLVGTVAARDYNTVAGSRGNVEH